MNTNEFEKLFKQRITRRHFFEECRVGIGAMALAALLNDKKTFAAATTQPARLDLLDYKPTLARLDGQPIPPSVLKDAHYAFIQKTATILSPRFKFSKHGKS